MRRASSAPFRRVVSATEREGVLTFTRHFRGRWWDLVLECGHETERSARYEKGAAGGRGFHALHHPAPASAMLPPPARVRCHACAGAESDG